MSAIESSEVDKVPLEEIDVSRPELFHTVQVVGDVRRMPNNFIRGIADVPVRVHPV